MHSGQIPDLAPGRGALSSPVAGVSSGAKSRPGPGPGEGGQPGQPGGHLEPGLALLPKGPGMLTHLVFCLTGLSRTGASWPGSGLRSPGWGASLRQLPLTESASSLLALKLSGFLS